MSSFGRTIVFVETSTKCQADWKCGYASIVRTADARNRASIVSSDRMITLRVLEAGLFLPNMHRAFKKRKSSSCVVHCEYGSKSASNDAMGGDPKVQQRLVEMVRLQVGKTRMTEFVDEKSQHLRTLADEAHLEHARIASRAMKGLDARGTWVLQQLDADAVAIERDLRSARAEIEAQSRDFEKFQVRSAYLRNEGLFFKNLYRTPRSSIYHSKDLLVEKGTPASENNFSSSYRQLLYGSLSLVIVSFMWSSTSAFVAGTCMRASKLVSYGIIISLLLTQLAYVKVITGEVRDLEESDDQSK